MDAASGRRRRGRRRCRGSRRRCAACGRTGGRRRRAAGPRGGPGRATWPAGRTAPRRRRRAAPARCRGSLSGAALGVHADDAAGVVEQRVGDGDPGVQPGAGRLRVVGEQGVELAAPADQAVVGPVVQLRPVDLDDLAAAVHAQALVPHPAGGRRGVDAHVLERLDPARGEPVAADLLAREGGLLEDDDVEPGAGEPVGGAGAGRAGADDEDVGGAVAVGRGRRPPCVRPLPNRPGLCESVHKVARSESRPGCEERNSAPRVRAGRAGA